MRQFFSSPDTLADLAFRARPLRKVCEPGVASRLRAATRPRRL